jgi:hypothetical protein
MLVQYSTYLPTCTYLTYLPTYLCSDAYTQVKCKPSGAAEKERDRKRERERDRQTDRKRRHMKMIERMGGHHDADVRACVRVCMHACARERMRCDVGKRGEKGDGGGNIGVV